jgi:hypothetical protein
MIKAVVVLSLLAIALSGFAYGAFHLRAFLNGGGTPDSVLGGGSPSHLQPARVRAVRGMGLFSAAVALMLLITAIWGPVE